MEIPLLIATFTLLIVPPLRKQFFPTQKQQPAVVVEKRDNFFDLLKGLSIIAVVFIHVTYFFYYYYNPQPAVNNFINAVLRFTIPIFFISSGILLNPVINNLKNFYLKKIIRIFIPYIIANVVIASTAGLSVLDFLYGTISGQLSVPYYFMSVLLQLYLLYPLLVKFRNKKLLLYGSLLISLGASVIPVLSRLWGIPLFTTYLFFFVYGIYYRNEFLNYDHKQHIKAARFWMLIIIGYCVVSLVINERIYNQRLLYGVAVFNMLFIYKDQLLKNEMLRKTLITFGKNTLWIYLIHFPIVATFFYFSLQNVTQNFYGSFVLISISALTVTYILALLLERLYGKIIGIISQKSTLQ